MAASGPDKDLSERLVNAAKLGHTKKVEELLEAGANVEAVYLGTTSLIWAAFLGKTETVKVLLANGAKVNTVDIYGGYALRTAHSKRHTEIAVALLRFGAGLDSIFQSEYPSLADKQRLADFLSIPYAAEIEILYPHPSEKRSVVYYN